jgi:uncharacterized protein YigE (DUF2233 family)
MNYSFFIKVWLVFIGCLSVAYSAEQPHFTVVAIDTTQHRLGLYLYDDQGNAFKRFNRLAQWLEQQGKTLGFAMNAGMFQENYSPVGLLVANGKQLKRLNLANAKGNFYMKPNGIFLVSNNQPYVMESSEYLRFTGKVDLATQSGPLLVRHNQIHPIFKPNATSRLIRNGVGVNGTTAYFVMSERPVNFYEFAAFFRDELKCPDALYFDGVVSSLYSAKFGRNDDFVNVGPMIGIAE